jgi:AraC-like DNA-binding protein
MAVTSLFEDLKISFKNIRLGEVELNETLDPVLAETLSIKLNALGFELIDDRKSSLIVQIKSIVIDLVHYTPDKPKVNLSDYLSDKLHYDYNHISNLFSAIEGTTIEKYFIAQKIERVKEFLVYDELSLSEISFQLGYSSVAHLSSQFKKVTGLTPSHFKQIRTEKRKPLDQV